MKKIFALLLVLFTLAFAGTALADDLTAMIESTFDGVWVQFEDGFEVYLPADWLELEVTEDMLNSGIFYSVASEDGAQMVSIAWQSLEEEMEMADLVPEFASEYPDAQLLDINGVEMIGYTDTENDLATFIARDAAEPGMYMFYIYPGSDEAYSDMGAAIALSIRNIEE